MGATARDRVPRAANANSNAPIAGNRVSGNPAAETIVFSSILGKISFGTSPCHIHVKAIPNRAKAWIRAIRILISGGIPRSIHRRRRSKLHAVAQPMSGRNRTGRATGLQVQSASDNRTKSRIDFQTGLGGIASIRNPLE